MVDEILDDGETQEDDEDDCVDDEVEGSVFLWKHVGHCPIEHFLELVFVDDEEGQTEQTSENNLIQTMGSKIHAREKDQSRENHPDPNENFPGTSTHEVTQDWFVG